MADKSPAEIINHLRAPLEPSHGIWELWRRALDGFALLIEQNEKIIELLGPTEKK